MTRIDCRCACARFTLLFVPSRRWTDPDGITHTFDKCESVPPNDGSRGTP